MHAMVLAAGLGTRLLPLTEELPKAAVPVLNRPIGAYALDHLADYGVRRAVINTHHLHEVVVERLTKAAPPGMELVFLHEDSLLGTGGGVRNARDVLFEGASEAVVVNADALFEPDLDAALHAHRLTDAIATMIVRPNPDPNVFGPVEVDERSRVRRILGVPPDVAAPVQVYMFTGVHILSARAFDDLPSTGCIIRTAYHAWLRRGETITAAVDHAPWRDVGTVQSYLDTNIELLAAPALVHESVHVPASARLSRVVVGADVRIAEGITIEHAVIWEGARVETDIRNAVVTARRVVSV